MFSSREAIYAALFAKVSQAAQFATISRRLQHWTDVSPGAQPALYQAQVDETAHTQPGPGLPTTFLLRVDLYIYANTQGDATLSPSTILNPLIDAALAAIAPNAVTGKQTLGGLVDYCQVDGRLVTDEGVLGDQGVCIIPIVMKSL
jgi:hypothetical protein